MSAKDMVNMADTAWKIIERGAPSADINSSTANAVPDVDDWQSLNGAQGPKSLRVRRVNRVGWPFDEYLNVDVQIALKFEYGATYRGGGLFVPNIYVEVPECFLGWNYHADIDIHVRNPSNSGSDEAPIARVPVSISGTISCPFWSSRVEWGYTLFGTGNWERN